MKINWKNYLTTLTKELGEDTAEDFIKSLHNQSNGSIKKASKFFYELGRSWAPIIHLWSIWIKEKAEGKSIALILRDAKPLTVIKSTEDWKGLYLNRQNCGIYDELSGDNNETHPLLKEYLQQNSCSEYFTFVDSGCYGTVVLELYKLGINFKPLFFFSKNPNIPGFLNEIGITEKEGEILNDSLECAFPNIYQRPDKFYKRNGNINVFLKKSDELSFLFGKEALMGVKDFNFSNKSIASIEAQKLLKLSEQAREGVFTGILSKSSQEWSKKKEFLENWPKDLNWV